MENEVGEEAEEPSKRWRSGIVSHKKVEDSMYDKL
jgi:hypothetical protein